MTTLRLAIVGAGPAGIYAADIAKKSDRGFDVSIDLFERLPAPYGLVRYGVAPDHPRIKGIIGALREVLDGGAVRLFGNVDFGTDITLDGPAAALPRGDLRDRRDPRRRPRHPRHRPARLVRRRRRRQSWYDGHPDVPREWPLDAREIAVIGNGNVALDVARMLAKHADDLMPTEMPRERRGGPRASSPVTDVHVFGRRGPANVKFTPLELRELGEVRDVDMVVHDEDFDYDEAGRTAHRDEQAGASSWTASCRAGARARPAPRAAGCTSTGGPAPSRSSATDHVEAIRWERTEPDGIGGARGTGEFREQAVQAVYRAVGLLRLPAAGPAVRRAARRDPEPRGPGARRRGRARARRLRDRLDQARPGRPDRAHEVRRDGDGRPRAHATAGHVVVAARAPTSGPSSSCSSRAACATRRSRAGTCSTRTSSRSARPRAAPASRSCRATRCSPRR